MGQHVHLVASVSAVQQKRGRRTKPAPDAPAKGLDEQNLADAPMRGRGNKFCLVEYKSPRAQVGGFVWKQFLTLTRRSNCPLGDTSVTQVFAVNLSKHELEIPGQQSIPLAPGNKCSQRLGTCQPVQDTENQWNWPKFGPFRGTRQVDLRQTGNFFHRPETAQAGNTADLAGSSCDEHGGDGETSAKLIIGGRQVRESLFVDRCHQL